MLLTMMRPVQHRWCRKSQMLCSMLSWLLLLLMTTTFASATSDAKFATVDVTMQLLSVSIPMDQDILQRFTLASQLFFESRVDFYPVSVLELQTSVLSQELLVDTDGATEHPLVVDLQVMIEYAIAAEAEDDFTQDGIQRRVNDVLVNEKSELVSLLHLMESSSPDGYFATVQTVAVEESTFSEESQNSSSNSDGDFFGAKTAIIIIAVVTLGLCLSFATVLSLLISSCCKKDDNKRRRDPTKRKKKEKKTTKVNSGTSTDKAAARQHQIQRQIERQNSMSASTMYHTDVETVASKHNKNQAVIQKRLALTLQRQRSPSAKPMVDYDDDDGELNEKPKGDTSTSSDSTESPHGRTCRCKECLVIEQRRQQQEQYGQRNVDPHLPFRLPTYITRCPPRSSGDSVSTMTIPTMTTKKSMEAAFRRARSKIMLSLAKPDDGDNESVAYPCDQSLASTAQDMEDSFPVDVGVFDSDDFGSIAGSLPDDASSK